MMNFKIVKESEKIKLQADKADNDLVFMGLNRKAIREKRFEDFEEYWLEKLQQKTKVSIRNKESFTIESDYGLIDFFPRSDKILIRKRNKWKNEGLKFIINKIINS